MKVAGIQAVRAGPAFYKGLGNLLFSSYIVGAAEYLGDPTERHAEAAENKSGESR